MEIIIAGAGKVGYHLAKTLSIYHNITIIDKNPQAISKIQDDLDVLAINGDVEDPQVYERCSKKVDFFIAVTNSDETNIISALIIDDIIEVNRKILRFQNNFFQKSSIFEKLNIYKSVFASSHIANRLKKLLEFPYANNIKEFSNGMVMLSVRVNNPDYIGYNMREIAKEFEDRAAIVGIEREQTFFIPQRNEVIKSGDLLYIFGDKSVIQRRYSNLETPKNSNGRVKNCIIFGADRLGVELARVLLDNNYEVKLIETNLQKCKEASEALQGRAIILNSRYGWGHLLKEEGLDSATMLIASTTNDEFNIIKCIEGKQAGIEKVIAINNDREYYQLMHSLGLVVIRGEKIDTYYSILENINADSFVRQKIYCGGRGIALSKDISLESKCIDKQVTIPAKIKEVAQLFIIKNDELIEVTDSFICNSGDRVVLFSKSSHSDFLEKWIYEEL